MKPTVEELVKRVNCLDKTIEEVREQGSELGREASEWRNKYLEVLEDNELLNKENKAQAEEITKLKRENMGLKQTVVNQQAKLDKYFNVYITK